MKTFIITALLMLFCLSSDTVRAQANPDGRQFSIFYSYGIPSGSFSKELISEGSPRGVGFELTWKLSKQWRLGPSFGFQDFHQKGDRELLKPDPATDISAVVSNSIQIYPVMAKAIYLPMAEKEARLQPFLSAGVGGAMVSNRQLWGMFDVINSTNFSVAMAAGAGLQYALGSSQKTSLFASANYQFVPYRRYEVSNLNSINIQAGVRLRLNNNRSGDYYQQTPSPRYYRYDNRF
jgi:opacity protein-like surface antigen